MLFDVVQKMKEPLADTIRVFQAARQDAQDNSDQELLTKQITALEEIRTALEKPGGVRYQIENFEKLISDPWMNDSLIFDRVYTSWRNFKDSYARTVGGMTVNERLYYMGLLEDFEASKGNATRMRSVLRAAFLSPDSVEAIIKNH